MIEQRVAALERQLDAQRSSGGAANTGTGTEGGGRGQLAVQFFEKRRRKAWLSRGDEEVCWETWTVKVTVAEPRTESGKEAPLPVLSACAWEWQVLSRLSLTLPSSRTS